VEYAISIPNTAPSTGWQASTLFSNTIFPGTTFYVYARSAENDDHYAGSVLNGDTSTTYYRVIFHSDGGNYNPPDQFPITRPPLTGESVDEPNDPVKDNHSFAGWYSNSTFTGSEWNFPDIVGSGNTSGGILNLYAKWVTNQNFILIFKQIEEQLLELTFLNPVAIYTSNNSASRPATATITLDNPAQYTSIQWSYGAYTLGTGATLVLDSSDVRYNATGDNKLLNLMVEIGSVPYGRVLNFAVKD